MSEPAVPERDREPEYHEKHSQKVPAEINIDHTDTDYDEGVKVFEYRNEKREQEKGEKEKIGSEFKIGGSKQPRDLERDYEQA
jgi:hypothetical protein